MDASTLHGVSTPGRHTAPAAVAGEGRQPLPARFATYLPIGLLLGGTFGVTAALISAPGNDGRRMDPTVSRASLRSNP
jgi:hypothetical protein